ncbi:site-specific DNA-methyltransferase [Candidatus Sumerlaeota bacterium]|nr:site-specific DNA-methyltransferase [Candidatus Sumerlaeota bacterium]
MVNRVERNLVDSWDEGLSVLAVDVGKPGGPHDKPRSFLRLRGRDLSRIAKDDFNKWFQQFWTLSGASTKDHPAPFPLELAFRLVRMFSFTGDTVLDPFLGTGTTMVAAMKCGRNSIGVEVEPKYARMAARRLQQESQDLFAVRNIEFLNACRDSESERLCVREDKTLYRASKRGRNT